MHSLTCIKCYNMVFSIISSIQFIVNSQCLVLIWEWKAVLQTRLWRLFQHALIQLVKLLFGILMNFFLLPFWDKYFPCFWLGFVFVFCWLKMCSLYYCICIYLLIAFEHRHISPAAHSCMYHLPQDCQGLFFK